jgi:hypothetical protein
MLHEMNPHSDSLFAHIIPQILVVRTCSNGILVGSILILAALYPHSGMDRSCRFPASDSQDQAALESWVDLVGHGWCSCGFPNMGDPLNQGFQY